MPTLCAEEVLILFVHFYVSGFFIRCVGKSTYFYISSSCSSASSSRYAGSGFPNRRQTLVHVSQDIRSPRRLRSAFPSLSCSHEKALLHCVIIGSLHNSSIPPQPGLRSYLSQIIYCDRAPSKGSIFQHLSNNTSLLGNQTLKNIITFYNQIFFTTFIRWQMKKK